MAYAQADLKLKWSGPALFTGDDRVLIFPGDDMKSATLFTWSIPANRLGAVPALERFYRIDPSPNVDPPPDFPVICRLSPDGGRLMVGTENSWVDVWDTKTWHRLYRYRADAADKYGNTQVPLGSAFSPSGRLLATYTINGLRFQDLSARRTIWVLPLSMNVGAGAREIDTGGIEFLSDDLAVLLRGNNLCFLDLRTHKQTDVLILPTPVGAGRGKSLFLSPTGQYLAVLSTDDKVFVVRLKDRTICHTIHLRPGNVWQAVEFYGGDRYLLSDHFERTRKPTAADPLPPYVSWLDAYDINSETEIGHSQPFPGTITHFVLSHSEKLVAVLMDKTTSVLPFDPTFLEK